MTTNPRACRLGALAFSLPLFCAATAHAQTVAPTPEQLGSNGAPPRHAEVGDSAAGRALASIPFGFVENRGQWDTPARFIGSRGLARIHVEPTALTVAVAGEEGGAALPVTRFVFEGASEHAHAEGVAPAPGVYNFFRGDAERHAAGVRRFENVVLRDVYTGIDVRLREHQDRLEYDVLLAPGANLDEVVVRCEGVQRLELADDGRLLLHTACGEVLVQSPPVTWAELPSGELQPLECRYVLLDATRYGYSLPDRTADLPVVIDPGLEWSTFLGGVGFEEAYVIDTDPQGRVIVGGFSNSANWALPGTGAPYSVSNGGNEAYVAVLDPSANGAAQVVWWTFFGGSGSEWIWDMTTNAAGQVFLVGDTTSIDFPVTANAFQGGLVGNFDGFLTVLDPVAGALVHSTYFGGSQHDTAQRVIVDGASRVTIGGGTLSPDMPTTPSAFDTTFNGFRDGYFATFDLSLSGAASLVYSTFLGGSANDAWVTERQFDLALRPNGIVAVALSSASANFPTTPGAFQVSNPGGQTAVFVEIDTTVPGNAALLYGTFLGSSAGEGISQIESHPAGGYVLSGFTYAASFPTTPGAAFDQFVGPAGFNDAWLVRFDPTAASPLLYSTLLPGDGYEGFLQVRLDANGTAYGVGFSGRPNLFSNSLPVTCNAYDKTFDGESDGFVLALAPNGNGVGDVRYLSFIGGTGGDNTQDLIIESVQGTPTVLVSGLSNAADFPTTAGAAQSVFGGDVDGFAMRLQLNPFRTCVGSPNSAHASGAHVCASGPLDLASNALVLSVYNLPANGLGYFLMSKTEVTPFSLPAPSQGILCLGSPIVRFAAFVQSSGPAGTVLFQPNLANIPPPGTPLVPGDTAVFQYWYRDTGGSSNTSSALAVTFD